MPDHATTDRATIGRALISVSDKSGLVDLGRFLAERGVEILSTGGTARALADADIAHVEIDAYTGFPEMMDGRLKTLHPRVHGGILAVRDDPAHDAAMVAHGIGAIDLVVVNLYPFEDTVATGADAATCVENIDIGGPALLRAAAKNHAFVTVIARAADYELLCEEMTANDGATTLATRRWLATEAFRHTAAYDAAIAAWFGQEGGALPGDQPFPARLVISARRAAVLRYGENPHQRAALYMGGAPRVGVTNAAQVQGRELSFNNLNDTDAAYELVAEFTERPAVAIIKHANPCGVAVADTLVEAYRRALACDPISAFGGIVATNRSLDRATAVEISKLFTEVVIAPGADADARASMARKPNLRLLLAGPPPSAAAPGTILRAIAGGYLMQTRDRAVIGGADLKTVTRRAPRADELADLLFAFTVAKHVKSNAIVYAKDGASVGIGAGQMSRVDAARIAAAKAREAASVAGLAAPLTQGSVAASDAFFPFADGLLVVAAAGASAVIQPGGSRRDDEVIAAADEAGLAMVFTGMRHFRH